MMLSIGITVCDKDYKNCSDILNQIKERVKVEYEVIIIDNREEFKDEPTDWQPTFAFGYNAYQFSARAKIIELAKGDYLWFIDGDDTIREINDMPFDADIITFSYNTYPEGDVHLENGLFTENLYTWEMTEKLKPVLWNKFINKKLFSSDFIKKYSTLKIHTLEDSLWCNEALRHAESVRIIDKVIYFHTEGLSSKVGSVTFEQIKTLTTGLSDAINVMKDITDEDFFNKIVHSQYKYIMSYITKTNDIEDTMNLLMDIIPKDIFKELLTQDVYLKCYSQKQMKRIIESAQKRYGEIYPYPLITETVTGADGRVEQCTFPAKFDFDETLEDFDLRQWRYSLSIICLVYDGNVDYLYNFTKMIASKVCVRHEVVIVDNRADKSKELSYYGEAVVTKTEGNVGILDGRRKGFEASHNDYIWFIDIDDYILDVPDVDYGESDILVFSHRIGEEDRILGGNTIIPNKDFFTLDTLYKTNVILWNKWFKRKPLEMSYEKIPNFFCVYSEDNLLYFSCLLYSEYIKIVSSAPIYVHTINDNSTTLKRIADTESVDLLFAGYEQATAYMEQYFEFAKKITYLSPVNILFYLEIMAKSTVQDYFANKLLSLFGKERIQKAISMVRKYTDEKSKELVLSISSYFTD